MDGRIVRDMALDMPGTAMKERFDRPVFSVKKKTYITLWAEEGRVVMKLTPEQQTMLGEEHPDAFAPVHGRFGGHGWTNVLLAHTGERLFRYAMDLAWRNVAPKWLAATRALPPKG